ncbi:MAG: Xaa-Pro peptidase family protein [Phycisphaerales bacterium]|jgi:Xaa-Pro aminopeptidase|nr:Xaa-Pro peptidase family protein [Phycisphaerales bacterium]
MITNKEYASRRAKLIKKLKGAAGLVYAGDCDNHLGTIWRPHPHFEYLTGITNEPSAVLLLDPTHPTPSRREILFLESRDPEKEQWDGLRKPLGSELKEETGIRATLRTRVLPLLLSDVVSRCKTFATLMPTGMINQSISPNIVTWKEVSNRTSGCEIIDMSSAIPILRSIKSANEIKVIQEAINITARGFADAMRYIQPGVNEYKVQATLEYGYAMSGGRGSAFPTIVGSGLNSTVLHYKDNNQELVSGDLVCIDSGAFFAGYGADISRTVPVSGKFTKRQKEIYEIVLAAEEAAIRSVKPGVTFSELDAIARKIITKAGYGDYFIHSIGHHLGLETHDDCGPVSPLKKGSVITIEPGIYLPDEAIGVRIEDDILVTAKGRKNLSKSIPKTVSEIEKAMSS